MLKEMLSHIEKHSLIFMLHAGRWDFYKRISITFRSIVNNHQDFLEKEGSTDSKNFF